MTAGTAPAVGKILVHRTMSLDGFIAGPDDEMDWIFDHVSSDEFPEMIEATGAILAGRRTHEVGQRDVGTETGEAYGGAWSGPQFVMTHHPPENASELPVTFLSDDIRSAVATALQAAGGKSLEIFGSDLAGQCLQLGLVDEIVVHIVPILLGDGTRLFSTPGGTRIPLQITSTTPSRSVTTIRYRVAR